MSSENEYPRMVYHADGSHKVVESEQAESDLGGEWGREPNEAFHASQTAVPARVTPSGNEPLVALLIQRMKEEFPSLVPEPKRGPGRPPKSNEGA